MILDGKSGINKECGQYKEVYILYTDKLWAN
jgi:hypothetical protein